MRLLHQQKLKDTLSFIAGDDRYFWNLSMYRDFVAQQVNCRWFTPVIQGSVSVVKDRVCNEPIEVFLISRRQHCRGGTRMNERGIDDEANAANFVETEQIIVYNEHFFSFTILRGSAPLFWMQTRAKHDIKLSEQTELSS